MQIKLTILLVFFCLNVHAQSQGCAKYDMAMSKGRVYLIKKNFDSALIEFQAAQVAARECGFFAKEPGDSLKKVFMGLKAQRDEAIGARNEAEKAKKVAINSEVETKRALSVAKIEKLRADSALSHAEKLVNAFYFYEGRFALAIQETRRGEKKYGFINKYGDIVIEYYYEKAEPFDYRGFAKVKKKGELEDLIDYIIDTSGNEFAIAYKLSDLNKDITALDLAGQDLDSFPAEILKHTQLQFLLLNENRIKNLPTEIKQLKALQILDLSRDSLTSLPEAIGQLANLQTLDLNNNQLSALPYEIGQLKNLQTLNLYNNQLTALPGEIGKLTKLQTLDLSANKLSVLPNEIGQLKNLQTLNLTRNGLTALPIQIGQLKKLITLNLNFNALTVLCSEIGELRNLQKLQLHENRLKVLPNQIGELKNLKVLDYGSNYISTGLREIIKRWLPKCMVADF